MNKEQKTERIKRFMDDEIAAGAVFEVLIDSFMKEKPNQDVYMLAASRLSINLLRQGWKDLERYKNIEDEEKVSTLKQTGM